MKQMNFRKIGFLGERSIFIICFIFYITVSILETIFSNWTFKNPFLIDFFHSLTSFSLIFILFIIPVFLFPKTRIFFYFLILALTIVSTYLNFKPIDTYETPKDYKVLDVNNQDEKLIIQSKYSLKNDRIKHDTILVRDYFIFRKIIK